MKSETKAELKYNLNYGAAWVCGVSAIATTPLAATIGDAAIREPSPKNIIVSFTAAAVTAGFAYGSYLNSRLAYRFKHPAAKPQP